MRISDWSSDVCSSDLRGSRGGRRQVGGAGGRGADRERAADRPGAPRARLWPAADDQRLRRPAPDRPDQVARSEEHTSELQSLMRISYAVFCLKKKTNNPLEAKTKSNQQ